MSVKNPKFPEKEVPSVASDAGSREVPGTLEAGQAEHLAKLNEAFASKQVAAEQGRIDEANQLASEHLEYDSNERVFGLHQAPQHYETDPDGQYAKHQAKGVHEVEPVNASEVIERYQKHVPAGEK